MYICLSIEYTASFEKVVNLKRHFECPICHMSWYIFNFCTWNILYCPKILCHFSTEAHILNHYKPTENAPFNESHDNWIQKCLVRSTTFSRPAATWSMIQIFEHCWLVGWSVGRTVGCCFFFPQLGDSSISGSEPFFLDWTVSLECNVKVREGTMDCAWFVLCVIMTDFPSRGRGSVIDIY